MIFIEQNGLKSFYIQNSETVFFRVPSGQDWTSLRVGLAMSVFTGDIYSATGSNETGLLQVEANSSDFTPGISNTISMGLTNGTGGSAVWGNFFAGITSHRVAAVGTDSVNSTGYQLSTFDRGVYSNLTGYGELLSMSFESKYGDSFLYLNSNFNINPPAWPAFAMAPLLNESLSGNYCWNVFDYSYNHSNGYMTFSYNNPQLTNSTQNRQYNDKAYFLANVPMYTGTPAVFSATWLTGDLFFAVSWPYTKTKMRVHDFVYIYE